MSPPPGLPKMQYRFLGRSGLQVSAISLGGWLTYGGHVKDEKTFACMKAAYDVGINFFDCAEEYQDGASEVAMGQAIKKFGWKRNDLVISTKIYWGAAFASSEINNVGLSRKHIVEGLNASLARLGLEYVDLVFAHRPDRNTPMEETVRAFNHVIETGKAVYWGTSEWDASEIASAWRVASRLNLVGPLMEQPCYNMLNRRKVESEFAGLCEAGMGLTTFMPLDGGLLTGKYNDGIPADSRFGIEYEGEDLGEELKKVEVVKKLRPIAERLGMSQATMALAWVLKNERVSSAITGASRVEQIYESLKALDAVGKLTPEVMAEIDEVLGNKPDVMTRRFD